MKVPEVKFQTRQIGSELRIHRIGQLLGALYVDLWQDSSLEHDTKAMIHGCKPFKLNQTSTASSGLVGSKIL